LVGAAFVPPARELYGPEYLALNARIEGSFGAGMLSEMEANRWFLKCSKIPGTCLKWIA
jgi:hypothetical protein